MSIRLIDPCEEYENEFMKMLKEFREFGDGRIPYVMHFGKESFTDILKAARDNSNGIHVLPDMEAATTWWLAGEGRLLGVTNIRHKLNDYLEYYGGHIGYGIRPSERNKGYATRLLSLALEKGAVFGLKNVLVICDSDNIASAKVIQKNGGVLEDERIYEGKPIQRYWISTSNG